MGRIHSKGSGVFDGVDALSAARAQGGLRVQKLCRLFFPSRISVGPALFHAVSQGVEFSRFSGRLAQAVQSDGGRTVECFIGNSQGGVCPAPRLARVHHGQRRADFTRFALSALCST